MRRVMTALFQKSFLIWVHKKSEHIPDLQQEHTLIKIHEKTDAGD